MPMYLSLWFVEVIVSERIIQYRPTYFSITIVQKQKSILELSPL